MHDYCYIAVQKKKTIKTRFQLHKIKKKLRLNQTMEEYAIIIRKKKRKHEKKKNKITNDD